MSDVIDFSENIVDGGYFVLRKLQTKPFQWHSDVVGNEQFLGTYRGSGTPIRDALISMIQKAKRKIFVASFVLGDELLIKELVAAARRLRGGVYVITALDERSLGRGMREYEPGELDSPEERSKNFQRLTSAGVYVRGHSSCHAKFAVMDDQVALVGSANFVTKGFDFTGEANALIRSADQVAQVAKLFTYLWFSGCEWEVPPGSQYQVAQRAPESSPLLPLAPKLRPGELVWTDGERSSALVQSIRQTIDQATKQLTLSTYSIVGMMEKPDLILNSIFRAIERGVECRLFIRQRNAWPAQMHELLNLHDRGVSIHADLRNHAKVVIADRSKAVLFSANFDAKHGLDSGVEAGVILSERNSIDELNRYMDHVIENADTEFLHNPPAQMLDGKLAARWCKEWPGSQDLRVTCDDRDWQRLLEAGTEPVIYELNDSLARFTIGATELRGHISSDYETLDEASVQPAKVPASEKLTALLESVRGGNGRGTDHEKQGFFAACFVR